MRRIIPFLLGAAILAPIYLSAPAEAQTLRDIQSLEVQVQRAKQYGDWGSVTNLERQLNMARLQYQRANGMGEVNENGQGYNPYGVRPNNGYYRPGSTASYYPDNNGYYNPGSNGSYYPSNNGYYNPGSNGSYNPNNNGYYNPNNNPNWNRGPQGYYDQYGRWRRY
jgi:hypothetical protein